ncbi:MAG: glycosyltransferase family 2 protein [Bacteroidetes bacterium]|nr:glycosyltransferase family 2 protein [Bacteroidota bacterium]
MISVIIPLYNKAGYISKAIDAVLQQSLSDFELIIVNDGSTDNSLEVVQQINDNRIRIIEQSNAGVSTARNNGAKASKYELLAFLDADDWWDTNYLREMNHLIQKYPDAGLWASGYYKVKGGKKIRAKIGLKEGFSKGYINYFQVYAKTMWMPITSSSFIVQKNVFEAFRGFKPDLKIGEDFDLWVRIALKYKIALINKPLVYYNQDVDLSNRAVSSLKYYKPQNHFIFQLDYLHAEELKRKDLKQLLDNIRAYGLLKYIVYNKYKKEAKAEVNKINLAKQPLSMKVKYYSPPILVRLYLYIKGIGSRFKLLILAGMKRG